MTEMPEDPFLNKELLPVAKGAHEFYTAFLVSGFDKDQAMQLTIEIVKTMIEAARKNVKPNGT